MKMKIYIRRRNDPAQNHKNQTLQHSKILMNLHFTVFASVLTATFILFWTVAKTIRLQSRMILNNTSSLEMCSAFAKFE